MIPRFLSPLGRWRRRWPWLGLALGLLFVPGLLGLYWGATKPQLLLLLSLWAWWLLLLPGWWSKLRQGCLAAGVLGLAAYWALPWWWGGLWALPLSLLAWALAWPGALPRQRFEAALGSAGLLMLLTLPLLWLLQGHQALPGLLILGLAWLLSLVDLAGSAAADDGPTPPRLLPAYRPPWAPPRPLALGLLLLGLGGLWPLSGFWQPQWWALPPLILLAASTLSLHPLRLLLLVGLSVGLWGWAGWVQSQMGLSLLPHHGGLRSLGAWIMFTSPPALLAWAAVVGVLVAEQRRGMPGARVPLLLGLGLLSLGAPLAGLCALAAWGLSQWTLAPWPRRRLGDLGGEGDPGGLLPQLRRAAWHLPTFEACFTWGKYRGDPCYGQLAADPRPWGRILDAGCGNGLLARLACLRPGSSSYVGVDMDGSKLQRAQYALHLSLSGKSSTDGKHHLETRWYCASIEAWSAAAVDQQFEHIFLLDVLHYWPPAQQQALLASLAVHLAPGGILYLREGIRDSQGSAGAVARGEWFTTRLGLNPGSAQLHFPQEAELQQMLLRAGLHCQHSQANGDHNQLWRCQRMDAAVG